MKTKVGYVLIISGLVGLGITLDILSIIVQQRYVGFIGSLCLLVTGVHLLRGGVVHVVNLIVSDKVRLYLQPLHPKIRLPAVKSLRTSENHWILALARYYRQHKFQFY